MDFQPRRFRQQIQEQSLLRLAAKAKIAGGFELNLGFVKGGFKSERDMLSDPVSRVQAVEAYIRRTNEVGTIAQPKSWISDKAQVRMFHLKDNSKLVFFAGRSGSCDFLLAGSSQHLLGQEAGTADKVDIGWSFLPRILNALRDSLERQLDLTGTEEALVERLNRPAGNPDDSREWLSLISVARRFLGSTPELQVQFLAKRFLGGENTLDSGRSCLLGSPLFVAEDDEKEG